VRYGQKIPLSNMESANIILKMAALSLFQILGKHNSEQRRSLFVRQFELFGEFVHLHTEISFAETKYTKQILTIYF
jgi:hypothetical protein